MEEWRTIAEAYRYEISSEGRVRNKKTGRVLKPQKIGRTTTVQLVDAGYKITRSVQLLATRAFAD